MIELQLGMLMIQLFIIAVLLREIRDKMPPPPPPPLIHSNWYPFKNKTEYDKELESLEKWILENE